MRMATHWLIFFIFSFCVKTLISTRGVTSAGTDAERYRSRAVQCEDGFWVTENVVKVLRRTKMVERIFSAFSVVDIHDHQRQGTLSLETSWLTIRWEKRLLATMKGIEYVDAFILYRNDFKRLHNGSTTGMESLLEFTGKLAHQMIFNKEEGSPEVEARNRAVALPRTRGQAQQQVVVVSQIDGSTRHILLSFVDYEKQKVADAAVAANIPDNAQRTHKGTRKYCIVCQVQCCYFCTTCSDPANGYFLPVCNPFNLASKQCYFIHVETSLDIGDFTEEL